MVQPRQQSPDDRPRSAESSSKQSRSTWRVLLVEDSPDDLRSLARSLNNAGADVTLECNAEAALKRITSANVDSQCFDVIVTDLRVSGLDGITMTRRLRKECCSVPIVMCSAETDPTAQRLALEAGCDSFLDQSLAHEDIVTHVLRCADNGKPPRDSNQIQS